MTWRRITPPTWPPTISRARSTTTATGFPGTSTFSLRLSRGEEVSPCWLGLPTASDLRQRPVSDVRGSDIRRHFQSPAGGNCPAAVRCNPRHGLDSPTAGGLGRCPRNGSGAPRCRAGANGADDVLEEPGVRPTVWAACSGISCRPAERDLQRDVRTGEAGVPREAVGQRKERLVQLGPEQPYAGRARCRWPRRRTPARPAGRAARSGPRARGACAGAGTGHATGCPAVPRGLFSAASHVSCVRPALWCALHRSRSVPHGDSTASGCVPPCWPGRASPSRRGPGQATARGQLAQGRLRRAQDVSGWSAPGSACGVGLGRRRRARTRARRAGVGAGCSLRPRW